MAKNWEQKIPKALVAKVQKTNAKPAKLAIEERNLQREISALSALEDKYTENLMIQHLPDDSKLNLRRWLSEYSPTASYYSPTNAAKG